jgi:tRNA modification GTPase TrmE
VLFSAGFFTGDKMDDTIAAVSTAFGEGGIGIVRISGEDAGRILDKIFVSDFDIENRKLTYGHIVDPDNGEMIDEVLAVYMKAPNTYTREDVVEIDTHGSVVSLRKTLSCVLKNGARPAEKGEFTKRAFLNGRLDLSQAEAVMDVVSAKTDRSFDVALGQLEGRLSDEIDRIRKAILDMLVNVAVNIDYPDEDIEEIVYADLSNQISQINDAIKKLAASAGTGKMIRDGLNVAIIGRPNVGKSSLMNALLRESRAIVTEIPGTTRDTIEENLSIRNIPVKLIDTAGIRSAENEIEKIGIEKSKQSFNNADLVIFVIDANSDISAEDREIIKTIGDRHVIVLANKQDLGQKISTYEIRKLLPSASVIETSMADYTGIDKIENEIENLVYGGIVRQKDSLIVTNARHESLLHEAVCALNDAQKMADSGEALDFIDIDIRRAYDALGQITGETVEEDILNEVFSRFCLGK